MPGGKLFFVVGRSLVDVCLSKIKKIRRHDDIDFDHLEAVRKTHEPRHRQIGYRSDIILAKSLIAAAFSIIIIPAVRRLNRRRDAGFPYLPVFAPSQRIGKINFNSTQGAVFYCSLLEVLRHGYRIEC